ncbi:MAG TPA: hypothetical protein VGC42_04585, partial [Kofleriaceae bacterium]
SPSSALGQHYQRVLQHSASLYHQMLSSWVGIHVEPLASLRNEPTPPSRMPRGTQLVAAQS